jgi:NAD+ synthase (glutamine-hydrolysing)
MCRGFIFLSMIALQDYGLNQFGLTISRLKRIKSGMKITIAQLNPIVGDLGGNLARLKEALARAVSDRADLIVFPELFITGYPPRDLLNRASFIKKIGQAVNDIKSISNEFSEIGILFGAPAKTNMESGRGLYNAAFLIQGGKLLQIQQKSLLPTYDVFDEARYFDPARQIQVVELKDEVLGISICEDAWNDPELWPRRFYNQDPIEILAAQKASILINISASPYHMGKEKLRFKLISNHAKKHQLPFVFVNQVGGNDELVFDGRSIFVDKKGRPVWIGATFAEVVQTIDTKTAGKSTSYPYQEEIESVYEALVLGIRDYVRKCGFRGVMLGLSGGIDSAVTCALACAAVGSENVWGVTMPGPFSSKGSVDDSIGLAKNLGIQLREIPIGSINNAYLETLKPHFAGRQSDIAEENIQARIRGNILMALSNKFGYLVLSTGNKSEMAVGYCTLYGDMSGGLSVISDVPKTMVYKIAEYINRNKEIIPRATITKPPSAELRANQTDQDSLPPYDVLDQILQSYLEDGLSSDEIVAKGFARETVAWVIKAIVQSEYKRRQAAPGLKVTSKAFGIGRRMPIAARYL